MKNERNADDDEQHTGRYQTCSDSLGLIVSRAGGDCAATS